MTAPIKTIKVSVDKSHLLTLGERMYVESIELIRELISNAYDADATEVYVFLGPENIVVEDNGTGMNEKDLSQFFTIGSTEKRQRHISPRFGRQRIGQFGIGKLSALALADCFMVESKKGRWVYQVIFDKEDWQKKDNWELPIRRELATPLHHEGTKITLSKLKKKMALVEVEKYLKEAIPLRAKKFIVFLNNKRLTARYIPGRRQSILHQTIYGSIKGEIIIAASVALIDKPGLECRVRQVLIKRDFFDLERAHPAGLNRLTGEVNADFLPIISARTDFIKDSPEYQLFYQLIRYDLEKILKNLKKEQEVKNLKKTSQELKYVLSKIREALKLHPELTPSGRVLARRHQIAAETTAHHVLLNPRTGETASETTPTKTKPEAVEKSSKIERPPSLVSKRIRIKKLGISVSIVFLEADGPEVYSEGNLVFINADHSLYKKLASKKELFNFHLLRLITQEIVIMKKIRLPAREAFEKQSKLLTDALVR